MLTGLLADEKIKDLLAEVLFEKLVRGVAMDFFDSAARAALAAVGRLKRAAAESWPIDLTPLGKEILVPFGGGESTALGSEEVRGG